MAAANAFPETEPNMLDFIKKRKTDAERSDADDDQHPEASADAEQQTETEPGTEATEASAARGPGLFTRLKQGLARTRSNLAEGLGSLILGRKTIDDELLEDIESQLLSADLGLEATDHVIQALTQRLKRRQLKDPEALMDCLKEELQALLEPCSEPLTVAVDEAPCVILVVGVNGAGKTTTIGKLARKLQDEGRSVMLAAGDTFRAAAVEQLQIWGERNSIPVIAQPTGADSASVIYDAYQSARARGSDVLIADTAGRLHNKGNLMQELAKIVRVLNKQDSRLPHETLLVLDATTGQNALSQARTFHESINLSGIALTKLDGTAKGGMVFAIAKELRLPIRFIGVGEKIEDLRPFQAREFVSALFSEE